MSGEGGFRDSLVARLRYVIELRGKSVARVEQELGRSRGFLGDALRGGKRLPIETILEVLDLLRVDPQRFFAGAIPQEGPWGAGGARRRRGGPSRGGRLGPDDAAVEVEQLARRLRALVRLLDEKGYVSREELGRAVTSLDGSAGRS